jgi:hypothetical protein
MLGAHGFGSFSRKKRASAAGPKPGNTEHHVDTRVEDPSAIRSPGKTVGQDHIGNAGIFQANHCLTH